MSRKMPISTAGLRPGGNPGRRSYRHRNRPTSSHRLRERTAMNAYYAQDLHASARRDQMLAEANLARQLASTDRVAPAAALRSHLGAALIRTGRRVQGAHRPAVTHGVAPSMLRTAR